MCLKKKVVRIFTFFVKIEKFAFWCQGFGLMFSMICTKSVTMLGISLDNFFLKVFIVDFQYRPYCGELSTEH